MMRDVEYSLEREVIKECSPTLAGIKVGSLFNYTYEDAENLSKELRAINQKLNVKGVYLVSLRKSENHILLYVFRPEKLLEELNKSEMKDFLMEYGYETGNIGRLITHLKDRITGNGCFPHEIGVFLGYPLEDVKAFIKHKGHNCKCCGVWKVYCDEQESVKTFNRFRKCTEVYRRVFNNGRSIIQLTVSA